MEEKTFLTPLIKIILAFTVLLLTGILLIAAPNPFKKALAPMPTPSPTETITTLPTPSAIETPTPSSTPEISLKINKIEISDDEKSVLRTGTKEVILTIDAVKKYLKNSGYEYDPDTFYKTDAKYLGDCFGAVALSNNEDKIVFSAICLPGDAPQPWTGIYNITKCSEGTNCDIVDSEHVRFLIGGSGNNFIWSNDDKTISYEADLGLSGLTETRIIDSVTGKIK
jgi:hypothetical protein